MMSPRGQSTTILTKLTTIPTKLPTIGPRPVGGRRMGPTSMM